jgi:putative flippase GtrA
MSVFAARFKQIHQLKFLRFAFVGTAGFLVNECILFISLHFGGLNKYQAWFPAFAVAVTFTWWGNRTLTFREHAARNNIALEWFTFVLTNGLGALANFGTYYALVKYVPAPVGNPLLANVVGTLVGLVFNFTVSSRVVFRKRNDGSNAPAPPLSADALCVSLSPGNGGEGGGPRSGERVKRKN